MNDRVTTILVIDDDQADVSLLRNLLDYRWDGRFRLIHVEDLETALAVGGKQHVDVALLDLSLPGGHGLECFLKLYARLPGVPIVVLSTYDDEALAMKAVQAGAQDYLVRSHLSEQLLVRSVRYAIERAGREQAEETLRMTNAQFRVARDIQRSLFPTQPPSVPGLDLAGMSRPAEETGGDFFDYLPLRDGALGVVIADVSSHGLGSALLMAETRAYLRALSMSHDDVGEVLTLANRILAEDVNGKHFVTVFFARIDPTRRTLVYAGAGHAAHLISAAGEPRLLSSTCLPLGIDRQIVVPTAREIAIAPGDVLFLCTDGIQEAQSPTLKMFGMKRALEVVQRHAEHPAAAIIAALHEAVAAHLAGRSPHDDMTTVAVKVNRE